VLQEKGQKKVVMYLPGAGLPRRGQEGRAGMDQIVREGQPGRQARHERELQEGRVFLRRDSEVRNLEKANFTEEG
jgi:hypothetical protein